MNKNRNGKKILFVLITTVIIFTPPLYSEDDAVTVVFNIYKGLSIGYTGFRTTLLFTAPFLDPEYSGWIYDYYALECHQLPEHSFVLNGRHMPLCARCTGIVVGLFAGHLAYPLFGDFLMDTLYKEDNMFPALGLLFLGMLPMIADGGTQALTDYESNNPLRLATGILFGVSLSLATDVIFINFTRMIKHMIE